MIFVKLALLGILDAKVSKRLARPYGYPSGQDWKLLLP